MGPKGEFEATDNTVDDGKEAARAVYREYVKKCYGAGLDKATIEDLTQLVFEDEASIEPPSGLSAWERPALQAKTTVRILQRMTP